MKRKILSLALILALSLTLVTWAAPGTVQATPAASNLTVDGKPVSCAAYEIVTDPNGYANTYFKLRDVAMVLSGTPRQFNVEWDEAGGLIRLTTGAAYVPVGGELASGGTASQGMENTAPVLLDGRQVWLESYTIAQNNYFKLRDLGAALDFGVDWVQESRTIALRTDWFNLNVAIEAEPISMDPTFNSAVDGAIMVNHLFEGLMKWSDDGSGGAVLTPGQAVSYDKTASADGGVVYTFHLREDARWSDGRSVTAGDFVYAWRRLVDPASMADYSYIIDMVKGWDRVSAGTAEPSALGVYAPDDRTFVVELTYDCPYFLEVCAFANTVPLRADVAEQADWTYDPATYLSNGPYRLKEWVHNSYICMEASDTYYDRASLGPDTITFHLTDDIYWAWNTYLMGELDFIAGQFVPEDVTQDVPLNIRPYVGTYYVNFNTAKAPFDDARVRKAFNLALDRNALAETLAGGHRTPADALVPPGAGTFREEGGSLWSVDPADYAENCAEARRLLAEAGYPGGKGFPEVAYLYNTGDMHRTLAVAMEDMWAEQLGVTVRLQEQPWYVFMESRRTGAFDMARNGWIADYTDPMSFLDMWVTGNGNNDAQYSNPAYDAAVSAAKATADPAQRMARLHEAERILLVEDQMLAPIFYYTNTDLCANLKGLYYSPLGLYFFSRCTPFSPAVPHPIPSRR